MEIIIPTEISLELVLGTLGSLLGIVLMSIKLVDYWKNRSNLKLDLMDVRVEEFEESFKKMDKIKTKVSIMNRGYRQTTIRDVALRTNRSITTFIDSKFKSLDVDGGKSINYEFEFPMYDFMNERITFPIKCKLILIDTNNSKHIINFELSSKSSLTWSGRHSWR